MIIQQTRGAAMLSARTLAIKATREKIIARREIEAYLKASKGKVTLEQASRVISRIVTSHAGATEADIKRLVKITCSPVIPANLTPKLKGNFIKNNLKERVKNAIVGPNPVSSSTSAVKEIITGESRGSIEDIANVASTIVTDVIFKTVDAMQTYYTSPDDGAGKDFLTEYGDTRTKSLDDNALSSFHWERVTEANACDWCTDPNTPVWARHHGCLCSRTMVRDEV